jgi:hypothetical protein
MVNSKKKYRNFLLIEGILKKRQKGHNIAKPKTLTEPFSTVSAIKTTKG